DDHRLPALLDQYPASPRVRIHAWPCNRTPERKAPGGWQTSAYAGLITGSLPLPHRLSALTRVTIDIIPLDGEGLDHRRRRRHRPGDGAPPAVRRLRCGRRRQW